MSIKSYQLFIALLFATIGVQSQNYYPLLGDSNTWYVTESFEGCNTRLLKTSGDTIINGLSYTNLWSSLYNWGGADTGIMGYLREDTGHQKVYFKQVPDSIYSRYIRVSLYDFSLTAGDSIFILSPNFDDDWFQYGVDSIGWFKIDSTSFLNTCVGPRKIIYLELLRLWNLTEIGSNYMQWVEGIGAINGAELGFGGNMYWLNCSFRENVHEYIDQATDTMCYCNSSGILACRKERLYFLISHSYNGQNHFTNW